MVSRTCSEAFQALIHKSSEFVLFSSLHFEWEYIGGGQVSNQSYTSFVASCHPFHNMCKGKGKLIAARFGDCFLLVEHQSYKLYK